MLVIPSREESREAREWVRSMRRYEKELMAARGMDAGAARSEWANWRNPQEDMTALRRELKGRGE